MYCDATCIVMHDDAMPKMLNAEHRNVRLHSTEPSKHQAKKVTLLKQDDNQAPGPEYISNNSYVHYVHYIVRVKRARNYSMMRALGSTLNGARRWPVLRAWRITCGRRFR